MTSYLHRLPAVLKPTVPAALRELTVLSFVLDKSGSMQNVRSAVVAGFNQYKREQGKVPHQTIFALTMFNTEVVIVHPPAPIETIPNLSPESYIPGGGTALYDAIGQTVIALDRSIKKLPAPPNHIIFAIMTDGLENASAEWTLETLQAVIKEKRALGWVFILFGAHPKTKEMGTNLHIPDENTQVFVTSPEGTLDAFSDISATTTFSRRRRTPKP